MLCQAYFEITKSNFYIDPPFLFRAVTLIVELGGHRLSVHVIRESFEAYLLRYLRRNIVLVGNASDNVRIGAERYFSSAELIIPSKYLFRRQKYVRRVLSLSIELKTLVSFNYPLWNSSKVISFFSYGILLEIYPICPIIS